jgi:threonine/homoserine/homoserine lactone efflux protein
MPVGTAFVTFLLASLALNFAPGPDMLYVIGRSVGQGRRAGVISALGIFTGCLVHITLTAAGMAAIIRSSPVAFNVIRYAGALYLLYLGVRLLVQSGGSLILQQSADAGLAKIFSQGVITNVLNPKVALFFLAFLPQFVDVRNGNVALHIIFLGLIFDTGGTLVNLAVASAGGYLGEVLRRNRRIARMQQRFTGLVFVGLGLRLGLNHR